VSKCAEWRKLQDFGEFREPFENRAWSDVYLGDDDINAIAHGDKLPDPTDRLAGSVSQTAAEQLLDVHFARRRAGRDGFG
jgi:hypothetical protein